jgi:hypothetical protein
MRLEVVHGKRPAALKTTAALCAQRKTVNGARSSSLIQIGCSTRQLVFMTFVAEDEAAARVVLDIIPAVNGQDSHSYATWGSRA